MVKKLVSLYNGTISVDSVVGEGTTFTIDFRSLEETAVEESESDVGEPLGDAEETVDG